MNKTWLNLSYFQIIIAMYMKDGMNANRLDECHQKRERMVKINNIGQKGKNKVNTT